MPKVNILALKNKAKNKKPSRLISSIKLKKDKVEDINYDLTLFKNYQSKTKKHTQVLDAHIAKERLSSLDNEFNHAFKVSKAKQDNVYPIVVYTPQELYEAQEAGAKRIRVKGELANKLSVAFKGLRSLSSSSFNALALVFSGAALFAPFTGGVSLGAAGTVMGTVGAALTATAIAAIASIGVALVIAVFKGYEEVKLSGGGIELVLKSGNKKS